MQIQIKLPYHTLNEVADRRAYAEAFGLDQTTMATAWRYNHDMNLLVTDAQFGRFVALRNLYGGVNCIKALHPKVIANDLMPVLDVTGYAA